MKRFFLLRAAFAGLAMLTCGARADEAAPVAAAAHLVDEGDRARLSFDLSAPIAARAREIEAPDRILLDMPEVDFRLSAGVGRVASAKSGSIVKAFRFGLFGPGKSRIVVDLAQPACVVRIANRKLTAGAEASRMTLELKPCTRDAFAAAAADHAPPPAPEADSLPAEPAKPGQTVIVLDPGHGGIDGGAFGIDGAIEKNLVLAFAEALRGELQASGRYRVVMTREADQYVSLEDRVARGRAEGAALFVSIHADTLKEAASVSGTTVYTCSDRASDVEAQRIAERENDADRQAGDEHKAADPGVADILRDLKRRETRSYAHRFSRGLVARLGEAGVLNRNPERSAGFVVLKAPDFPSVLVELGYLSNAHDVANLKSESWRKTTAQAMRTAIDGFFAGGEPASASIAATAPGGAPKPSP